MSARMSVPTSDREPPQMLADATWNCTGPCKLRRKVVPGDVVVQPDGRVALVHVECAQ